MDIERCSFFVGEKDSENAVPMISVTKASTGKPHEKSSSKWGKFMANGKSEPVSNGKAGGTPLSLMKASRTIPEGEEHETQLHHKPLSTQHSNESVNHKELLETLLDIKYDIKKEVSALNDKMSRLDTQIEVLIKTIGSSYPPQRRDSSPNGSSMRFESEMTETRSTSPDSNSSLKAPKRLSKLTKGSKVSPQLPALNNSGDSPVKSKSTGSSRQDSALSITAESGASGLTLATTVDMADEETGANPNSQRKNKISNLDML